MKKNLLFVFGLLGSMAFAQKQVLYVKQDATGSANGSSWTNAFTNIQSAFDAAAALNPGTGANEYVEIWVAKGTYYPTALIGGNTSRHAAFNIPRNVKMLGGFAGNEPLYDGKDSHLKNARRWRENVTILSGDIGVVGDNSDNSYHVFRTSGGKGVAEVSGFTITGGNANGSGNDGFGGGAFDINGGYISTYNIYTGNYAQNGGSAIYGSGTNYSMVNLIITRNSSNNGGSVMSANHNTSYPFSLTNSTIYNNQSQDGISGINVVNQPSMAFKIHNSVVLDKSSANITSPSLEIRHSMVEGVAANAATDKNTFAVLPANQIFTSLDINSPDFLNPIEDGPIVGRGLNSLYNGSLTVGGTRDLYFEFRLIGKAIDLGARESKTDNLDLRLSTKNVKVSTFKYYPSNVVDFLNITSAQNINSVEVYATTGQLVKIESFSSKEAKVNFSNLPTGVYVVKVKGKNDVETFKIVKK